MLIYVVVNCRFVVDLVVEICWVLLLLPQRCLPRCSVDPPCHFALRIAICVRLPHVDCSWLTVAGCNWLPVTRSSPDVTARSIGGWPYVTAAADPITGCRLRWCWWLRWDVTLLCHVHTRCSRYTLLVPHYLYPVTLRCRKALLFPVLITIVTDCRRYSPDSPIYVRWTPFI